MDNFIIIPTQLWFGESPQQSQWNDPPATCDVRLRYVGDVCDAPRSLEQAPPDTLSQRRSLGKPSAPPSAISEL